MIELFINNTLVDLSEDVIIPLTKEVNDIRNPDEMNSDYTKTIVIPGTANNNKLFGFIFDVSQSIINQSNTDNFLPDFNPNLKASCRVYVDSVLQIEGYASLLQINIVNDNLIEYEISIVGQLGNLFVTIGAGKLSDLDFGIYNHNWNIENIVSSWSNIIMTNGASGSVDMGVGYVYPIIDYGYTTDIKIMKGEWLRPAIYVKTIVDKIFSTAGYSYTSDSYFNSAFFKRLIIPYTGTGFDLSAAQIALRTFEFESSIFSPATVIGTTKIFEIEAGDTYNQFNITSGILTVSQAGYYKLNGYLQVNGMNFPITDFYIIQYDLLLNGVSIYTINIQGTNSLGSPHSIAVPEMTLVVGDTLEWFITKATRIIVGTVFTNTYEINTSGYFKFEPTRTLPFGQDVNMNTLLPNDILQKDFLVSLTRMLNLYWDKTDIDKVMYIQTRDNYLSDNINNYEYKLDISKTVNILPMGELDANPYEWSYKPDKDYYNDLYTTEFNKTYGDFQYYINNDFVRSPKKTEIIFSPTVLANEPAWVSDMVVSSIKHYDTQGNFVLQGGNIRILYYGGLKATSNFSLDDGTVLIPKTSYPYAGHLDDPYNSTLDLNFGTPLKVYFPGYAGATLTLTGNTLFEIFWANFINEITNKDSKIVRAWFRLRAQDIFNIDFSYLYYFKGQYFRLNKMFDHDTGHEGITQMEFFKSRITLQEGPPVPPPPPPGTPYTDDYVAALLALEGITLSAPIIAALEAFEIEITNEGLINYASPGTNLLRVIYPFVNGTASAHKYNFLDPRDLDAAYRQVFSGGLTHDANGMTGNGTNGYSDTKYNPSTQGDDISFSAYSRVNILGASRILMMTSNGDNVYIYPRYSDNHAYTTANTNGGFTDVAVTDTLGLYTATTAGTTSHKLYKNGSVIDTKAKTLLKPNANILLLKDPLAYAVYNICYADIGKELTAAQELAKYNAVQALQTSLGRNV